MKHTKTCKDCGAEFETEPFENAVRCDSCARHYVRFDGPRGF